MDEQRANHFGSDEEATGGIEKRIFHANSQRVFYELQSALGKYSSI